MDKICSIAIVVPTTDFVVSSISATHKIFRAAIAASGRDIKLYVVGATHQQKVADDLFSIHAPYLFEELPRADLVIIPALKSDVEIAIAQNEELIQWIGEQYQQGAHLASLCSGVFLLGSTGLLANRRCTSHWMQSEEFRRRFPTAIYRKHNVLTEDERIFTSGGAFTFLNLVMVLVERFFGKEIALQLNGLFQVDHDRRSQDHFIVFNTQKAHHDEGVKAVQSFIEENFRQKLTLAEMARVANLGQRTMVRRFKAACGNTPIEYLQRVRTEKAKTLLTATDQRIGDIQSSIGYNDAKIFRSVFSRQTGFSPSGYRKRYSVR